MSYIITNNYNRKSSLVFKVDALLRLLMTNSKPLLLNRNLAIVFVLVPSL